MWSGGPSPGGAIASIAASAPFVSSLLTRKVMSPLSGLRIRSPSPAPTAIPMVAPAAMFLPPRYSPSGVQVSTVPGPDTTSGKAPADEQEFALRLQLPPTREEVLAPRQQRQAHPGDHREGDPRAHVGDAEEAVADRLHDVEERVHVGELLPR